MIDRPAVAPPPSKSRLARAPAPAVPDNMTRATGAGYTSFVDLNFKVNPRFHKRFRVEAANAELSLKDLMIEAFEGWLVARDKQLDPTER